MSEMSPDGDPDVQEQEQEQAKHEEAARQAADTVRSISRLEESN